MIVVNKRQGQIVGPRPRPLKDGEEPHEHPGAFTFQPGVNEVPESYLKSLDVHGIAALDSYFDAGYLDAEGLDELESAASSEPARAPSDELSENEAEALATVKASTDRKQLAGWLEHEKRETVFDALIDQINALDGGHSLKA